MKGFWSAPQPWAEMVSKTEQAMWMMNSEGVERQQRAPLQIAEEVVQSLRKGETQQKAQYIRMEHDDIAVNSVIIVHPSP